MHWILIWSSGWQVLERNVAYDLQIGTCTLIVIICNMNINICLHCIRESTYSKAWSHYDVRLSSLNLNFPSEVNSIDICIDSEDIGSYSAFKHVFVNIPIVADHVCLKYLEQLCFVPAVVWCQLSIPESPSPIEYNGRRIAPCPGPRSSLAPTQIQFLRYLTYLSYPWTKWTQKSWRNTDPQRDKEWLYDTEFTAHLS